jgi:DNA polymerase-3 subunit gamma/tau
VVDRLRTIRRLTWTLVSENAQVLALDPSSLTLGFPTQGLADAFNQRGHSDCVKEALLETLGVERKAVGVVGGRASGAVQDLVDDGPTDDGPEPEHVSAGPDDAPPPASADGWPQVSGPSARPPAPPGPAAGLVVRCWCGAAVAPVPVLALAGPVPVRAAPVAGVARPRGAVRSGRVPTRSRPCGPGRGWSPSRPNRPSTTPCPATTPPRTSAGAVPTC